MCVPFGMGKVIDIVSIGSAGAMPLPTVVSLLGGLFAVGSIANIIRVDTSNMIGERITNRLRQDTYASILKQELGFFDSSRTGELLNRLSADTTLIGKVLSDNVASGLRSTGQAFGSITMIVVTCPKLAMIMLSVVPPIALGAMSYGRYVKKLTTQVQTELSTATEVAEEKLGNMRVVRWFSKEAHEVETYRKKIDQVLDLARKRSLASATFFGGVDLGVKMCMLGVLGYGGQMVTDGLLTSGELTSFLLYTLYVGFSFAGLSSFYAELMKGLGASSRVFELLNRQPKTRVPKNGYSSLPVPFTGHIQFQDVAFAYPTRTDSLIFSHMNLEVRPNETLALVGPSGCGKSSVTSLLARFYELDGPNCRGKILLDGVDIATLDPTKLRELMGAVPQEPPLFACSIRDNIAYGCSDSQNVTLESVINAAKAANAHDFIMAFPDGYDTIVGERGQALSGGQKQRVAIARALVKRPKILIMDEATSALDPESERLVQDAVNRAKQGRTLILMAHRLSTIKSADRIVVISNGQVVEQGTFDELSCRKGSTFAKVILSGQM
ncbi:atp-binding cassette sub-family b member mitochondrial [Plasmopara halstedii]|uniref:Atp-binding cassette sub-family b member mitochondrial n=1 Tax=Plasmopara halstedii TaxID=4781 RepID=A0A0P1B560_PLAHL|nr:atp-binding cassette sub-family b member mitochondrial [Plasmopara halstedii]CEG49965.1 atp-binding cassette sub-family b member mitochondrial [Plasmopara halstedii]|eukprot:XP_024586334.1 atp-binding cassette sub-family b member mitochondrial [Plasmopara halstedii]